MAGLHHEHATDNADRNEFDARNMLPRLTKCHPFQWRERKNLRTDLLPKWHLYFHAKLRQI